MSYIVIQTLNFNGDEIEHEVAWSEEEAILRGRQIAIADPSIQVVIFKGQDSDEVNIFYKKNLPWPRL